MDAVIRFLHYLITMTEPDLVFLAGERSANCDAFVDKHFDGYHTLQYVDRGKVELFYDDERHEEAVFEVL